MVSNFKSWNSFDFRNAATQVIMKIGEVIKILIKNRGFSQNEVAKRIGKSSTALSQIVKGVYNPQPDTLERLSNVLDVPTSVIYFLSISEDDVPEENRALFKALAPSMEKYMLDVFNAKPDDLEIQKKMKG